MKKLKFYNKNGDLSIYGLACGYIQKYVANNGQKLELWHEGCTYHVRRVTPDHQRIVWEVFDNDKLTEARKFYAQQKKAMRSS
jgi:hypothetical protein